VYAVKSIRFTLFPAGTRSPTTWNDLYRRESVSENEKIMRRGETMNAAPHPTEDVLTVVPGAGAMWSALE